MDLTIMSKKTYKKTRKDYDYYTMNIPNELRILYEAYITKYPNLGFKNVSQYILHVLQLKAENIIQKNPDLNKIEEIKLSSGTYVLQDDGTYKRMVSKEEFLEKIEDMWEGKSSKEK